MTTSARQRLLDYASREDMFLVRLHVGEFDVASFCTMVDLMQHYLESPRDPSIIERPIAEIFYMAEQELIALAQQPYRASIVDEALLERARLRMLALCHWLFIGESLDLSGALPPFDATLA